MRLLAPFILAMLLPAPALHASMAGSAITPTVARAIDEVCLPTLRRQVNARDVAGYEKFLAEKGFKAGISSAQLALFPPGPDITLSRATLVSAAAGDEQLVMAIGGYDLSCRLFVISDGAGADLGADLGEELERAGWTSVQPPAHASPRLAYIRGTLQAAAAIALILWTEELPGVTYHAVVVAK